MKRSIESIAIVISILFCCLTNVGCDSDNLKSTYVDNVYFFENGDTSVDCTSSVFELKMDKKSESYPKDWELSDLMVDSNDNFSPLFYDDDCYYRVPEERLCRTKNGISYKWLSVQKVAIDGVPGLRISVEANDTEEERAAKIVITRDYSDGNGWYFGEVRITQKGKYNPEPFEMKVRYKGKIYSSPAHHDENGEIVMEDENFRLFMENLESRPGIEAVVMDDEIVDYFDNSDDEEKSALTALRQSVGGSAMPEVRLSFPPTRADAFRYMGRDAVGYFAVFDDSGYTDSHIAAGFTKFTDYFDVDYLRRHDLNDKISSLAVAYKGTDPEVCSVLTVWEDSYFNNGDNDRTKHRISFIADHTNPLLTVKRLKNIKCINSGNSWNDRISSLSFHFGYFDSRLRDY